MLILLLGAIVQLIIIIIKLGLLRLGAESAEHAKLGISEQAAIDLLLLLKKKKVNKSITSNISGLGKNRTQVEKIPDIGAILGADCAIQVHNAGIFSDYKLR